MTEPATLPKRPTGTLSSTYTAGRMLILSIIRRFIQCSVLLGFVGTVHLGWSIFGYPLLSGDLSSSLLLDTIPLSDPFAVLQKILAGHPLESTMISGALTVLVFYIIFGGRSFCAWVCPMNIVTDFSAWLRVRLHIRSDMLRIHRHVRYALAFGALLASCITGSAAFEWFSPQAFLWRELVWGIGWGCISSVLGIFAFDLLLVQRGWCGHLCPLGAFWSCVGSIALVKPKFINARCTRCGQCLKVCPESQVIHFNRAASQGYISSGECTNCGRCAAICPENAIHFGLRTTKTTTPLSSHQ